MLNILLLQNLISQLQKILLQDQLATKSDIGNFVGKTDVDDKLKNLNEKVTSNKAKHLLVKNELKKLQTFASSLFIGQSYFNNDGPHLFLIFQPTFKAITILLEFLDKISEWESKGLSNEKIQPPVAVDKCFSPKLT